MGVVWRGVQSQGPRGNGGSRGVTPGPKGGMVLVGSGLSEVDKVALKNWLLRQVGVAGVSHD